MGRRARVVSMPCWELFEVQELSYQLSGAHGLWGMARSWSIRGHRLRYVAGHEGPLSWGPLRMMIVATAGILSRAWRGGTGCASFLSRCELVLGKRISARDDEVACCHRLPPAVTGTCRR